MKYDSSERRDDVPEKKHIVRNISNPLASTLAIVLAIYHMSAVIWPLSSVGQYKIIHVGGAITLVLLISLQRRAKKAETAKIGYWIDAALFLIGLAASVYFWVFYDDIVSSVGIQNASTTVAGALILFVLLEVTRREWGWVIPIIVILGMAYALWGSFLPGIFHHGGMSWERLLGYAATNMQGIYGSFTALSLREVFLFVMLGSTLQAAGAVNFFMEIATTVFGKLRSGPAQASIMASGAMGSVSGNVTSNVASTGAITIPMMKRAGYSKEYAGGVEAAASTGSQIIPPVMGAAVFVMVANTGVPYSEIILIALAPSLIYYAYLSISAQITATKQGLPSGQGLQWSRVIGAFRRDGYLLLAFPVLLWFIFSGTAIARAALYTIIAIVILFLIRRCFTHRLRVKPIANDMKRFLTETLKDGSVTGFKLGLVMASLGVVVEMFVITGFAQRLSFQMVSIASGSLLVLLILVSLTCILFGMGMPTTGAYITVSVLAAPALVAFNVPLIVAHFYVLYFALMSSVTPPVGSAAIVASGISKGRYLKTSLIATRLALPGFLLPVYFVVHPELLMIETTVIEYMLVALGALAGIVAVTALIERHLIRKLGIVEYPALVATTVAVALPGLVSVYVGLVLMICVILYQLICFRVNQKSSRVNDPTLVSEGGSVS